jgi:hypothetical protein
MIRRGVTGVLWLCLSLGGAWTADAQAPRLVRALSGPSGKVVGQNFVLDETRTRFVYPQDRSLTVYFEWEFTPGDHELIATWIRPNGQVASISPAVRIQSASKELKSYWLFEIAPTLSTGAWTVAVSIDGQPAGSHGFEIAGTSDTGGRITLDHVFKAYGPSMVSVHRLDDAGRRVDSSNGFVVATDAVATSFQSIDAAGGLEVEFADGRRVRTADVWAVSRLGDWTVLKVETQGIPALPRGDAQNIPVGSRLATFGDDSGTRVVVPVDVGAVSAVGGHAARIRFSPPASPESVGGPVIDEYGKVVGILGGSMTPGLRVGRRAVTSNPALAVLLAGSSTATVLSDVPAILPSATRSLADLKRDGLLTTPLMPMSEFIYGGTTLQLPKDAGDRRLTENTEFSTRDDAAVHVYTFWVKRSKLSKGALSVRVYDAENRERSSAPPKKVTLRDQEQRFSVSWSPKGMAPGFYRIDVLWDGNPAWRTYIRIVE